jgi:superfamily II DNA or RNA helicase
MKHLIELHVHNDRVKVSGHYAPQAISLLRDYLSVHDSAAARHSGIKGWDGTTHFITKKGEFQAGFFGDVVEYLDSNGYECEMIDFRTRFVNFDCGKLQQKNHLDFELADHQLRATTSVCSASVGTFDHATASGKTYIMAAMINSMVGEPRVLVLVHDQFLFKQHIEFFSKYWETGWVDGKKVKPGRVVVAKYKSLLNRTDEGDMGVIDWLSECKCVFVDECHKVAGNEYFTFLSQLPIYSKFLFSGTPYDLPNDKARMRVRAIGGKVLDSVSVAELNEVGWVADVTVNLYKCSPISVIFDKYQAVYKKAVMFGSERLEVIKETLRNSRGENIIITVDKTEHLDFLYDNLTNYPHLKFYKLKGGDNSDEVKAEFSKKPSGFSRVLITTILQEGSNLLLHGLIYAQGGKAPIQLKQYIGRILRKAGANEKWVIDFFDMTDGVRPHSRARIAIYKEEGYKIKAHYPTKSKNFVPQLLTPNDR